MTVAAIGAILGGTPLLKRAVDSDADLMMMTREGLPVGVLKRLAGEISVDLRVLAAVVGISSRTLSRRLSKGELLSTEESDRTVRLARVIAKSIDTFGTPEKASRWLQKENRALDGEIPLSLLDTDTGVRAVETILGRIDYGLYS